MMTLSSSLRLQRLSNRFQHFPIDWNIYILCMLQKMQYLPLGLCYLFFYTLARYCTQFLRTVLRKCRFDSLELIRLREGIRWKKMIYIVLAGNIIEHFLLSPATHTSCFSVWSKLGSHFLSCIYIEAIKI